jgi:hypothetical protein
MSVSASSGGKLNCGPENCEKDEEASTLSSISWSKSIAKCTFDVERRF